MGALFVLCGLLIVISIAGVAAVLACASKR